MYLYSEAMAFKEYPTILERNIKWHHHGKSPNGHNIKSVFDCIDPSHVIGLWSDSAEPVIESFKGDDMLRFLLSLIFLVVFHSGNSSDPLLNQHKDAAHLSGSIYWKTLSLWVGGVSRRYQEKN
jgi:hypothetical protein